MQEQSEQRPPRRPAGPRVASVFGIPVYLNPSWLLLAVLVTLGYGRVVGEHLPAVSTPTAYLIALGFVVLLLLSVFLHELGHALVSRGYGIGVRGITLELLGGYTEMETEAPSPRAELLVSLAGPAVSAVLGGIGVVVAVAVEPRTIGFELAFQVALSNLLVAVFNVLPGLPLDGGRALRAVVWAASGDRHLATVVAGWAGRVLAVALLGGLVLGYTSGWLTFLGAAFTLMVVLVLWSGASNAIRLGGIWRRVPDIDLRALLRPVVAVPAGTPLAEALRRAEESGAGGIMVTDSAGTPTALVRWPAAMAVAVDRRPWQSVDTVARDLAGVLRLPVDSGGTDVAEAVRTSPAGEYLITAGEDVVGVLRTEDLAFLLEPRRKAP